MNKIKDFILKNKALVSITSSVTMAIFLIFTVIAVAISDNGSGSTNNSSNTSTSEETTSLIADGSVETDKPSQTVPEYSSEDETCGEEDETSTEEKTTEPPVDPNTLPYMIKVNRAANCLTVYGKDEAGKFTVPVKAITVSCGKTVGDTPLGTYQTINEYKWRKMVDGTYSQYAYRIVGPILFHSVPYYSQAKNDLEWEEFNKLGSPASLGCVRMTVADSKWLMDHCPIGTLVTIYDDAANPGPLGKPDTIKIPADSPYKNWDPTDPDPANPWSLFSATIEAPADKTVNVKPGTTIDEIKATYFTAKDTCGNDISKKIVIKGNYDLNVEGTYNLTVYVIDAIGSKAQVDITLNVKAEETTTEAPSTGDTTTVEPSTNDTTTENTTTENTTTEETTTKAPEETSTKEPATEPTTTSPSDEPSSEEQSSEEQSSEEQSSEEQSSEEQSSEEKSSEQQSSEEQSSEQQSDQNPSDEPVQGNDGIN